MSRDTPRTTIHTKAGHYSIILAVVLAFAVPTTTSAQDEKILLLTFHHAGTTVRNLVLYLYYPIGSRPIIERAAISDANTSELGSELQELVELRGTEFRRDDFLVQKKWLRDVNFDGHTDLVLPNSKNLHSKDVYLYQSTSGTYQLDRDGEYLAEPRIVESAALSQNHPTLLR